MGTNGERRLTVGCLRSDQLLQAGARSDRSAAAFELDTCDRELVSSVAKVVRRDGRYRREISVTSSFEKLARSFDSLAGEVSICRVSS